MSPEPSYPYPPAYYLALVEHADAVLTGVQRLPGVEAQPRARQERRGAEPVVGRDVGDDERLVALDGDRPDRVRRGQAKWVRPALAATLWRPRGTPRVRPRSSGEEHFSPKEGVAGSNPAGGTH